MKKALCVILAAVMLLSLCACGGGDENSEHFGDYEIVEASKDDISVRVDDIFEDGFTITLKARGKCEMNIDGQRGTGKWTLDGKKISISGSGVELKGTLKKGIMTLKDVEDSGVDIVLVLDGVDYDVSPVDEAPEEKPAEKDKADSEPETEDIAPEEETVSEPKGTGRYYLTGIAMVDSGILSPEQFMGLSGMYDDEEDDSFLVLNADGTGEIKLLGNEAEVFWSDGSISFEGDELSLEFIGDDILFGDDELFVVYTPEGKKLGTDLADIYDSKGYVWDEEFLAFFNGDITIPEGDGNDITFNGLVVADNDDCVIRITDYTPLNEWGYIEMKVYLENKSESNLHFTVDYCAVNGVEAGASLWLDVNSGEYVEDFIDVWV